MSELSPFELELLKQEYFFLHSNVEDYNKQIWTIKALGITGTGAVTGLLIQQKLQFIALIGISIPAFFWLLESQWKHFQRGFYPRIIEIEEILRNNVSEYSPSICTSWHKAFKRNISHRKHGYMQDGLFNPSVFVTYVLEIVFLIIIYFIKVN